jgi:tetratricopeptide (TPR) repeat protein
LLVACAGDRARARVAALLAHGVMHLRENRWPAAVGAVAAVGSTELLALREGTLDRVVAAPLGSARRALTDDLEVVPPIVLGNQWGDGIELTVLQRLDLSPSDLVGGYDALAAAGARGADLEPFEATHGALAGLRAQAASWRSADDPSPSEAPTLDLAPIVAEQETRAVLDAADLLVRRGQPGPALGLLDHAPDLRGVRAADLRGEALAALGRGREAERSLRAALLLDPGDVRSHLALADLFASQQRPEAARAELLAAFDAAPLSPEVHVRLGELEPDADRARARLETARELACGRGPVAYRAALDLERLDRGPAGPAPVDRDHPRILQGGGGG